MAGEATTIARPYAEAVFSRAVETDKLDTWQQMLELLAAVVVDPRIASVAANPHMDKQQLTDLMLQIGGTHFTEEGQNLLRLLVENGRLILLPEISSLYEQMKAAREGVLDVVVSSAFPIKPAQEALLAASLTKKLDREVRISSEQDPELIGGVRICAGDLVIDGSIREKLNRLTNELGI